MEGERRCLTFSKPNRASSRCFAGPATTDLARTSFTTTQVQSLNNSANNKVIELSGDYDPKLYHQLAPHLRQLEPSYSDELSFDSNFECGNLSRVYRDQSAPNNFYCLLLNDSNTHGYTQWFCFRVRNTLRSTYTFHLMNMIKNTSMYRNGMKVAVFSEAQWQRDQRGWFKGGDDITYTNTRI